MADVSDTPAGSPAEDVPTVGSERADAAASAPPTQSAEFKQVTVLFADVVKSMDIAAALGVERYREVMTELVNGSAAVVQRYGGMVDKFTGDGIMAVFGAPAALEDHAVRACLAALGIQDEIARLARSKDRDGIPLRAAPRRACQPPLTLVSVPAMAARTAGRSEVRCRSATCPIRSWPG